MRYRRARLLTLFLPCLLSLLALVSASSARLVPKKSVAHAGEAAVKGRSLSSRFFFSLVLILLPSLFSAGLCVCSFASSLHSAPAFSVDYHRARYASNTAAAPARNTFSSIRRQRVLPPCASSRFPQPSTVCSGAEARGSPSLLSTPPAGVSASPHSLLVRGSVVRRWRSPVAGPCGAFVSSQVCPRSLPFCARLVARSGPRASPLASRQELGCALACFLPGSLAWLSMEREGARKRGRGGEEGGGTSTGKGHSPPTCYFTLRVGRAAHIITTSPKDVESLFSLFLRQACGEEKTPETELAFSGAVAGEGGPAKVVKPGLDQAAAGGGGGDRPHVLLEPQPGRLEVRADAGPSTQETPVDSERMSPRAPPPAAPEGSGRHAERGDVEGRRTAVKRSDDPLADISLHVMRRSSIGDVLAWVRASLLEDSGARAESSEASGMGGAAPQLFGGKTQGSERACTGGEESTTPSCASRSQEETQLKDVKAEGEEAKHLHSPPSDSPAWKKPRVSPGVDAPEGMEEAARRVKEELASSPLSSSWSQREERVLYIYTDGACRSNGRGREARGGIGVFFGDGDPRNVSMRLLGQPQTNQRAELQAILCAIRLLKAWEDGGRGYWGPVGAAGAKGEASGDAASEGARSGGGPRQAKDAGGGVSSCGLVAASGRVAPLSQRAGLAPSGRAAFATVAGNGKRVNGVELPQGDGGGTVTRRAKVDTSLDRGGAPCGGLHADRETFFEMHDPVKVRICSDSSYAINCITEWVYAWKMNGWRTRARSEVCNRDLVAEIDQLLQGRRRGDARFSSLPATTGADPVFVSGGSDGSDGHGGGEIARFFEKPKEVGDGRSSAAAEGWGGRGSIEFVLVKGHSGNYGNDRADQLACQGAALPSDDEEAAQ